MVVNPAKHNILRVMFENRKSQLYFSRIYYGRMGAMVVRAMLLLKFSLNAIGSVVGYLNKKFKNKRAKNEYARALICKKVILLSLRRSNRARKIPELYPVQVPVSVTSSTSS